MPRPDLVVGVCAGPTDTFDRTLAPGLHELGELLTCDVHVLRSAPSIAVGYEAVRDAALRARPTLGTLLLHDDVEIVDAERMVDELRAAARLPDAGVIGAIGADHPPNLRWWQSRFRRGGLAATERFVGEPATGPVHVVDGCLLFLVGGLEQEVEFDRGLRGWHGYDVDVCFQSLAAGRTNYCTPFSVVHHSKLTLGSVEAFEEADAYLAKKWRARFAAAKRANYGPRWRRAVARVARRG